MYIVPNVKHVTEYLEMFNIKMDRVRFSDQPYLVCNTIIPPNFNGYQLKNSKDIILYIRKKILDITGKLDGNKRVYVKRICNRRVSNETEVIDILNKYDFDVLVPENLSVSEQFKYMSNVDFSVMAHGANCTLTICQKIKSKYIEFFSNDYVNYHMLGVINALNLFYTPLVSTRLDRCAKNLKDTQSHQDDVIVPIDTFEIVLHNLIKNS